MERLSVGEMKRLRPVRKLKPVCGRLRSDSET